MKNWIVSTVVAGLVAIIAPINAGAQEQLSQGAFAWKCVPSGKNSVQCQFKNTGTEPAGFCVEVVKVCKHGDHSAYVCTGKMSPGDVESRVVNNFDPKVKFFESCQGIEYRNKNFDR